MSHTSFDVQFQPEQVTAIAGHRDDGLRGAGTSTYFTRITIGQEDLSHHSSSSVTLFAARPQELLEVIDALREVVTNLTAGQRAHEVDWVADLPGDTSTTPREGLAARHRQ